MYEIIKDGAVLALTESPNYIRLHPDGFYILCDQSEAQGVALYGTPYHLFGRASMDGLETVVLAETDAGRVLKEQETVNSIAFVALAESGIIDTVTAGNSKVKNFSGSADRWWARSPRGSDSARFCSVTSDGSAADGYASASNGVAFGFCF